MPVITVVFGLLMIALGIWGYFGGVLGLWEPLGLTPPEKLSGTALIPAYLGLAFVVLGFTALKATLLKHAMHGAALIGLLGLIASVGRVLTTRNVTGVSGASLVAMMLLCAVFVGLCINSFLVARRRRRTTPTVTST